MAFDPSRTARLSEKTRIGEMLVAITEGRNDEAEALFESVVHDRAVRRIREVTERVEAANGAR